MFQVEKIVALKSPKQEVHSKEIRAGEALWVKMTRGGSEAREDKEGKTLKHLPWKGHPRALHPRELLRGAGKQE